MAARVENGVKVFLLDAVEENGLPSCASAAASFSNRIE
jgi:hypothetical protein